MPLHERLRLDHCEDPQDRRKPFDTAGQEPAIIVREPDPTMNLTPQNDQLMSECRILCSSRLFDLKGEVKTMGTK